MDLDTALLWSQATTTTALAGLIWTVQVVVYSSFQVHGPTATWPVVHAHRTRAMATVVTLPWAVQGLTLAALLVRRPAGVPLLLLLTTGALAAATVVVTALWSVPLHGRLARGYDDALARRLVSTNWLRTAAWTGGAVCALTMLGVATGSP